MGIAPSRRAASQIVSHRHITVNGEVVNIPSYHLKPGDKVAVREKSKSLKLSNVLYLILVMFMNGLLGIMI
jgi:small subunit ribosomal protein S4